MTATLRGRCHCGSILVALETTRAAAELPLRACQCSFCRRHGARTTADPEGLLRITARDAHDLRRYRFGLGVTDFLVCGRCGVYVAATMESEGKRLGTVNVNVMDDPTPFAREASASRYDGEHVDERLARRKRTWMRTEIH